MPDIPVLSGADDEERKPPPAPAPAPVEESIPLPPSRPKTLGNLVEPEPLPLSTPVGRPKGFSVTPGIEDIDHGSDSPKRPEFKTLVQAAFRSENTIGAWYADETRDAPDYNDQEFKGWEAIQGTKYEPRWESFAKLPNNPRAFDLMKQKLDREDEDRKIRDAAPWWQSLPAEMAAGVLDWPTLLPGGVFIRGAKGGFSVLKSGGTVAAAAAASSAVQEGFLQHLVETRTASESAITIGASAMLGGLLGSGGAALLSRAEWKAAQRALNGHHNMPDAQDLPEFHGLDPSKKLADLTPEQRRGVEFRIGEAVPSAQFQERPTFDYAPEMSAKIEADLGQPIPGTLLRQLRGMPETDDGGIVVFHGSPHDFERFDISKIGTGEGAQAYGHGLYFAEREGVARDYQTRLSGRSSHQVAAERVRDAGSAEKAIDEIKAELSSDLQLMKDYRAALEDVLTVLERGDKLPAPGGSLYEVRIKADPDKFLDWDKPLTQQSQFVKEALWNSGLRQLAPNAKASAAFQVWGDRASLAADTAGRQAHVSKELREAGIEGIRYLDGGSRGAGDGSRNFVVFDDSKVSIVAKNGQRIERPLPNSLTGQAEGAFAQASKTDWGSMTLKEIADELNKVYDTPPASGGGMGGGAPSSAGAAANVPASLDENTIAGRQAAFVAAATRRLNPALRTMQSPSTATRSTASKLFEFSAYLKKNMMGVETEASIETLMKEWNGALARAITATDEAHSAYRKAGGTLNPTQFREEVGKAMRREDQHADPHIAKAAKAWRSQVFDPLKEAAIEAGLLPRDVSVSTAASYFTRMWDRGTLIAREDGFKGIVKRWVQEQAPGWRDAFDRTAERRLEPLRLEIRNLELSKLQRAETQRVRAEEGEISPDGMGEADIRQAMRIVKGDAPKPKGVETLAQFVHKQGGVVDFGGELAYRGITNKTRPGFVRARMRVGEKDSGGGFVLDEMARRAWEAGYFPDHLSRPSVDEFVEALADDFHKVRAVLRQGDRDAYRLNELIEQLQADLNRAGVTSDGPAPRFSTSEEMKGAAQRVHQAMDAEADRRIADLRAKIREREIESLQERDAKFGDGDDFTDMSKEIADEVFAKLTGKLENGVRPEFITIKARGPLKERTFNIPDELVEEFLENDVEKVGRRYTRVMGADVEMKNKFGSVDMADQIREVHEDYNRLREAAVAAAKRENKSAEPILKQLNAREKQDVTDIEAVRDLLRGTRVENMSEGNYGRIARALNHVNYIRSMGEVVLASLTDAVRPAMVHGLMPFLGGVKQVATNLPAIKMAVKEAQLAGNVLESVLAHRLAMLSDIMDPYSAKTPVEAFLESMSNVGSKWNGIRLWTDGMKAFASVLTQNRILDGVSRFGSIKQSEKAYLAYLGIGNDMSERIARQFAAHGDAIDNVRVANTEKWTDPQAIRAYRAAINKDVDSIIVQKSVADVPLFSSTPTGRMVLQFKSFALASHQKVLLRGLQEDQARFIGGTVAMTMMGMMMTYIKALSGNRTADREKMLNNPGWWVGEGFDRAGILSVPTEIANAMEKVTGFNAIKSPLKVFDEQGSISQKLQNRNEIGTFLGPTAGLVQDTLSAARIPQRMLAGEDVTQGQKRAAAMMIPFRTYYGVRQLIDYGIVPPQQ